MSSGQEEGAYSLYSSKLEQFMYVNAFEGGVIWVDNPEEAMVFTLDHKRQLTEIVWSNEEYDDNDIIYVVPYEAGDEFDEFCSNWVESYRLTEDHIVDICNWVIVAPKARTEAEKTFEDALMHAIDEIVESKFAAS